MVPASTMQASKALRQPTALLNYDTYEPYQQPMWHSNLMGAVVVHILWR